MKEYIVVSACLVGENCRYDGKHSYSQKLQDYLKDKEVLKVCPELMGGLATPRNPAECLNGNVYTEEGEDVTPFFIVGAEKVLKQCKMKQIKKAILKSKSPSCGINYIYNGKFEGKLIKGNGICAQLLLDNGIEVISSDDFN